MAQTIKLKRSATQNAVPSTSSLALGEIAINTYDGKLFIKKDVSGTESIVTIGEVGANSIGPTELASTAVTAGSYGSTSAIPVITIDADGRITSASTATISGLSANSVTSTEIAANAVGISELNVTDGTDGQVLTTDGNGTLTFEDQSGGAASATAFSTNIANGDGSTAAFTLSESPSSESKIIAFINGVFQNQDAYTISGTTITFDTAPISGTNNVVVYVIGDVYSGESVLISNFSGNGTTTAFTLANNPGNENNTQVYIDGVYQQKTTYSVSGTTLTFSSAPPTGTNNIEVVMLTSTTVNTPAAGSVVTASMADDSVTGAKLVSSAVTTAKIADANVTTAKIADANVTTAKIADDAVTIGKIADAALVIESEGIGSNDNDTTLPTSAAVKDYVDTQVAGKDNTDEITEGSTNLYFTDARADARITNALKDEDNMASNSATHIPSQQSVKAYVDAQTTDETAEGSSNLYFTNARADARIAAADTDDLSEGSTNLYYTDARVGTYISGNRTYGNITTTGYLAGPSTFTIDPAAVGDNTGTLVIAGNLQVDGTTTTINSTTLTVDDKLVTLASGSANAGAANGAGIEVDISGATNPSLLYDGTNDEWDFNKNINVAGNITAQTGGLTVGTSDTTGGVITVHGNGTGNAEGGEIRLSTAADHDTTYGFYRIDVVTDSFRIGREGQTDLTINSSGNVTFAGNISSGRITTSDGIADTGQAGSATIFNESGSTADFRIESDSKPYMFFLDGGLNRIGINTGTPSHTLHILNEVSSDTIDETNGLVKMQSSGGNGMIFGTIASSPYTSYIQSAYVQDTSIAQYSLALNPIGGNVGIGTTSPKTTLNVAANNSGQGAILTLENTDTSITTGDVIGQIDFYANDGSTNGTGAKVNIKAVAQSSAGTVTELTFGTSPSSSATAIERMRIDASGNVGIGTNNPTEVLHMNNTSATGCFIRFENTGGSGVYIGGRSEVMEMYTNGSEKMRITSDGKVGIGTNNPSQAFEVHPNDDYQAVIGRARIGDLGYGDFAGFGHFDTGTDYAILQYHTGQTFINASSGQPINFRINNATQMVVASSGNVGIGTTNPGARLHVYGTDPVIRVSDDGTSGFSTLELRQGDTTTEGFEARYNSGTGHTHLNNVYSGGDLIFATNTGSFGTTSTNERMRIDSTGNVGIGTDSPDRQLEVYGANDGYMKFDGGRSGNHGYTVGSELNGFIIYDDTLGAYRMAIKQDTGVAVFGGSSSFAHNTYAHAAVFTKNSTPLGTVVIEDSDVSSGIGNTVLNCYLRDQDPATYATFIKFTDGGGTVGSITHNDDGGGVTYNTTSDYRLKENVDYDWDGLSLLNQLKPAKFNFIRQPSKTLQGFLAHEVKDIVPSSVQGDKDHMEPTGTVTDSDGNVVYENVYEHFCKEGQTWTRTGEEPVYQELDYSRLVPLLTKAIQELKTELDAAKARLDEAGL